MRKLLHLFLLGLPVSGINMAANCGNLGYVAK